jgi:hypothetical protein
MSNDQRRADDLVRKLSQSPSETRADEVVEALVGKSPKRQSDKLAGGARSLGQKLRRATGPQCEGAVPYKEE